MNNTIPINTSPGAYQVAVIQMREREPHIATTKSWKYLNETAAIGRGIFYYLERFDPHNANYTWVVNLLGQIQIRFTEISRQKFLDQPKRAEAKRAREEKRQQSKREQHNAKARRYRKEHPEQIKETRRRYREKHPEKGKEAARHYRQKYREKVRKNNQLYEQQHPECNANRSRNYHWRNRDKAIAKQRMKRRGPRVDAIRIALLTLLTNRISQETVKDAGNPASQSGDSGEIVRSLREELEK